MSNLSQKITIGIATVGALASLAGSALIPTTLASTTATNTQNGASTVQSHKFGMMERKGGPGMPGMFGQEFDKNVTRSVQNIDSGVQITLTSTDAATVTKLQSLKVPQSRANADQNVNRPNLSVSSVNVSNGIQITVTSTDAATVTKLQTNAPNAHGFDFGIGVERGKRGPGMPGMFGQEFDKNVTRSVQNIDNGIQITLTSTDAATVTKLQQEAAMMAKMPAPQNGSQSTGTSTTQSQQ